MSGIATRMMRIRDALASREMTTEELAAATGMDRRAVAATVGKLIMRGLAERLEIGRYRLTTAGEKSAARQEILTSGPKRKQTGRRRQPRNTFFQRVWAVMRMQRRFSVPELMQLAASPKERGGSVDSLHRYLRALEQAGYVRRLRSREPGTRPGSNGFVRWILVRDTGPVAPALRVRERQLIDRNTGRVIDLGEARHDEAA